MLMFMKKSSQETRKLHPAFSLAETIAALTIAAMVIMVLLGVYERARRSAASVTKRIDDSQLPAEVLQRIAEDIGKIASNPLDVEISIANKYDSGFQTARLALLSRVYDNKARPQTFEEIIWQTSYDADSNSLTLYRRHSGIALEDKLLDTPKSQYERELFVPLCTGITLFKIQVPQGEELLDRWRSTSLPTAVVVTISFAPPYKAPAGGLDVPEEDKIIRTIAVDRTRKIRFTLKKKEEEQGQERQTNIQEPNVAKE